MLRGDVKMCWQESIGDVFMGKFVPLKVVHIAGCDRNQIQKKVYLIGSVFMKQPVAIHSS